MHQHTPFKITLLASLTAMAWAPASGWAQSLNLAQSPPTAVEPYVAPNVILSLDDSGSMQWRLDSQTNGRYYNAPSANGNWPDDASRVSVLKHALRTVFNDMLLLPDRKIRLAWQVMNGNNRTPTALTGDNAMRVLDKAHRDRFLAFVGNFTAGGGTPTHALMKRADEYMRQKPLGPHSAWASIPGQQGAPYLGCRRNYHILMTDGGWNQSISDNQIPDTRNYDGRDDMTLPDGRVYRSSDRNTRIYRDNDGGNFSTIADWAFKSWADPLQTAANLQGTLRLPPDYLSAPSSETFASRTNNSQFTMTDKYWNPRYNPATWPHMVTFTVGFSNEALPSSNFAPSGSWQGSLQAPSSTVPYGYDGDFAAYANGTFAWRAASADRGHDMWHAAINGRGKFYAVNRSQDLVAAFRQIVQQINVEAEPDRSSAATSGSSITRSAVGLYTARYDPQKAWSGGITGEQVTSVTDAKGSVTTSTAPLPDWQGKTTAQRLDELQDDKVLSSRTILAWNDDTGAGVSFRWNAIGAAQQAHLNRPAGSTGPADNRGSDRLDYLRGLRRMEGSATQPGSAASSSFRPRQSRQGDIINSAIWYTGAPSSLYPTQDYRTFASKRKDRTPMLYVGGNDGMLHGFSAVDGSEKLAYVPRGVMPGLSQLTGHGYDEKHRYFVDGSPMTGDVLDGSAWKTLLVGTLGAGGKGYFVLDATNPGDFKEDKASSLVLLDRSMHASETLPTDCSQQPDAQARDKCEAGKDIGHIFAAPVLDDSDPQRSTQITRLNNDRWAVVMGNGYNSHNGRPVLLIQYLDGNRELLRLAAQSPASSTAGGNGLSAPRLVDINGDGRPDVVYAGDLQGNLWKFLIASDKPDEWGVAFNGSPLLTLQGTVTNANALAITAPPTVRANDRKQAVAKTAGKEEIQTVGGMMVAFGTGRNVTAQDPSDNTSGAIYSVLDNTRYKVEAGLVQPCLTKADTVCRLNDAQVPSTVAPTQLIELAQDPTAVDGAKSSAGRTFWKVNGSELDWTKHKGWRFTLPENGERLLKPMAFYDSSNILAIYSQIPARASSDNASTQESCEASVVNGERQYLTLLNIMDGKRPSVQLMDANGDGLYGAEDKNVHRMTVSKGAQSMIVRGDRMVLKGSRTDEDVCARMPEQPVRPSWRQLQ